MAARELRQDPAGVGRIVTITPISDNTATSDWHTRWHSVQGYASSRHLHSVERRPKRRGAGCCKDPGMLHSWRLMVCSPRLHHLLQDIRTGFKVCCSTLVHTRSTSSSHLAMQQMCCSRMLSWQGVCVRRMWQGFLHGCIRHGCMPWQGRGMAPSAGGSRRPCARDKMQGGGHNQSLSHAAWAAHLLASDGRNRACCGSSRVPLHLRRALERGTVAGLCLDRWHLPVCGHAGSPGGSRPSLRRGLQQSITPSCSRRVARHHLLCSHSHTASPEETP